MELFYAYAQELGFLAVFIGILKLQLKERKNILYGSALNKFILILHYFAMQANTIALVSIVGFVRPLIMTTEFGLKHRYLMCFIILLLGGIIIGIWGRGDSLLENILIATSFITITLSETQENVLKMRLLSFATLLIWFAYIVIIGSYGLMIYIPFLIASSLLGLYRHHYKPYKEGRSI